MPTYRSDRTGPDGNRWVQALILALFLTVGTGVARTVRGYLSTTTSWDRFVRGPAVLGWLTAFVVVVAALVSMRWIRRRAFCVAAAVVVGAMAITGGTALGLARRCDTKSGRALLAEVVALTSAVEPPAVHRCGGKEPSSLAAVVIGAVATAVPRGTAGHHRGCSGQSARRRHQSL